MSNHVFCAIDKGDLSEALDLVHQLTPTDVAFKLGLEFFIKNGVKGVEQVRAMAGAEREIFLDLKLHDIPNTVAGAVRSALAAKPQFITVHASGGKEMIEAAVKAANGQTKILAVTVLTSLDEENLTSVGQSIPVKEQVVRLAKLAKEAGADGIVCSPQELEYLQDVKDGLLLVTPGIRLASDASDQKRVTTPEEAFAKGASYIVVGRPITQADNPVEAVRRFAVV